MPTTQQRSIRPPAVIPDAIYSGVVIKVSHDVYSWRSTAGNPEGLAARIFVAVRHAGADFTVVDTISWDNHFRLVRALASCGLESHEPESADASSLVGCSCRVVTKTLRPQQGRAAGVPRSVVSQWI